MSSAGRKILFVVRPGFGLVVGGTRLEAAVEDADESIAELAQCGLVTDAATAILLFFSDDEVLDLPGDVSTSKPSTDVNRARSARVAHGFTVPSNLTAGTEYYVIAQVAGTTRPSSGSGIHVEDWIPIRGTVEAGFGC
jgi:hypothetical protein